MTPKELAIDAPPASLKLVRQNATLGQEEPKKQERSKENRRCYRPHTRRTCKKDKQKEAVLVNDNQALHIYDQPNWVDTAEEAYRQANYEYVTPGSTKYWVDTRNPKHGSLHWTACTTDMCQIHYSAKIEQYFPCKDFRKGCKWQAYDCPKVTCPEHLWDKRVELRHFPSHSEAENAQHHFTINGRCLNQDWRVCLNDLCEIHYQKKKENGYATEDPFLEERLTTLIVVTPSTQRTLSN